MAAAAMRGAGAAAESVSFPFYVPVDVVVTRLQVDCRLCAACDARVRARAQVQQRREGVEYHRHGLAASKAILREDGPRGLFRGWDAAAVYAIASSSVWSVPRRRPLVCCSG